MDIKGLKTDTYQYYHVVPVEILFSDKLSEKAKLLFVAISGLCNNTGLCWATNAYFCTNLQWSKSSVNRALAELKENNLIIMTFDIKDGKVEKRTITTAFKKPKEGSQERQGGLPPETGGVVMVDKYNSKNRIIKNNKNKSSTNFSYFKKEKKASEMTTEEWVAHQKSIDKDHWVDETKGDNPDMIRYFNTIRIGDHANAVKQELDQ